MKQRTKVPPGFKFKMHKPDSAIAIEPGMMQKLFGKRRVIKVDDTGLVVLNINNERLGFQLYDRLFIEHKNSRVIVRFYEDDLNEVCLYDFKNDNFIATVKRMLVWTKDRPDVYYRHIGKVRKVRRLIGESREADEALLSENPKYLPDLK